MLKKEPSIINAQVAFKKDRRGSGYISYFDLAGGEQKVEFLSFQDGKDVAWELSLPGPNQKITTKENDHLYRLIGEEERRRNSTETDLTVPSEKEVISAGGIILSRDLS